MMSFNLLNKTLVIGIMVLFIGMSFTSSTGIILEKKSTMPIFNGKTLYVGGCGEDNYTRIQDAINDASDGDTVFVFDGTYVETLIVDKSINLIGEDRGTTIIDGGGDVLTVWIKNCNAKKITGFTIQNAEHKGLWIYECNNINVSGNIIRNNGVLYTSGPLCGMIISLSKNCIVSGNIFKNNLNDGLMIFSAATENNIVTGNVFENNSDFGLMLCSSYYDVVTGNIFRNNGCGGIWISSFYSTIYDNIFESDGIVMLYSADIDFTCIHTIENNTANGRPIRYYKNKNNLTIPEDTGQVIATNCKEITIQNITLSDVSVGIQLLNCSHCDINRNTITNNSLHDISLANTYRRSGHPLLQDSYSNNNTISGNVISNNWDGIMIFNACKNNRIYENDFENNTCAINITYGVDYHNYNFPNACKINTKSTLLKNLHEILMYRPVFFWFQRNDIRKNNFIDNKKHVSFIYNSFLFARWRGNYWDKPRTIPFPILGTFGASLPWVNFDWLPASEPYKIGV